MTLCKISLSTAVKSALLCVSLGVSLSACAERKTADMINYRETHAISAQREQVSISFAGDLDQATLNGADSNRLNRFLADYAKRGRGPVIVESANTMAAESALLSAGLNSSELDIKSNATAAGTILTFGAYAMTLPTCGDWSSGSSFAPTNTNHSNYGCALNRNLGLMLSDPGDLHQAQPATSGSMGRSDAALQGYQARSPIAGPAGDAAADPAATTTAN